MIRALTFSLLLLALAWSARAQEDPAKDPRNHAEHFNPVAMLSDDTIQWLMIQRLARTLRDETLAALGKVQLDYEKNVRAFEEKHGKEVNDIITAFGNTIRMPAPEREVLMQKFLALADQLPDAGVFQKSVLAEMSVDEAARLIKLLRDRRQTRLALLALSAGILEETTLSKESQAKILATYEPTDKKAYPYRSTAENIQQWVLEQSQRAEVKLTDADFAKLDRLLAWTQHRRLQVMNEALLALRVELPKEEFAKLEASLLEQGRWRVQNLEQIVLAPVKPDVPEEERDPLADPMKFNSLATTLRDPLEWFDQHKRNKTLPAVKIARIDALLNEYLAKRSEFDDKHRKAYGDIIEAHGLLLTLNREQRQKMMEQLAAFETRLPTPGKLHDALLKLLAYEEGAPLVKLMRTRRQLRVGLLETGTAISKDLDVAKESKERIDAELSRLMMSNAARRKVHNQLSIWKNEQPATQPGSSERVRVSGMAAAQSVWLMQEMINEVDLSLVALQKSLPAEDFEKLCAKAAEVGTPLTATFDPSTAPPLSAIAIAPGDIIAWVHEQDRKEALSKEILERLKQICSEYEIAAEAFREKHTKAQIDSVVALQFINPQNNAEIQRHLTALVGLGEKMPNHATFQRSVLSYLSAEQAAPLTKMLRERRQVALAVMEMGAGLAAKNLNVSKESKELIEEELRLMTELLKSDRIAFEKLDDWREKHSPSPTKTIPAMREDTPVARQLNWLMLSMIDTVESAMSTLEDDLPEADFAKLHAKALEEGAKLVEPLDPKPRKE